MLNMMGKVSPLRVAVSLLICLLIHDNVASLPAHGRTPEEAFAGMSGHVCQNYLTHGEDVTGGKQDYLAQADQFFHANQFRDSIIAACKAYVVDESYGSSWGRGASALLDRALFYERKQKEAKERAALPPTPRDKLIAAYDAFLSKHKLVEPEISQTIIKMVADPDSVSGRIVFVSGWTLNTSVKDKTVFLRIAMPYTPTLTYTQIAFHPKTLSQQVRQHWTCVARVMGSMTVREQLTGTLKSIPEVKEIECLAQ